MFSYPSNLLRLVLRLKQSTNLAPRPRRLLLGLTTCLYHFKNRFSGRQIMKQEIWINGKSDSQRSMRRVLLTDDENVTAEATTVTSHSGK